MSKASKRAKRYLEKLTRENSNYPDVALLKEAAHYYWMKNIVKCAGIFFPLMDRLIVEPLKDTDEYKEGQNKPDIPFEEEEEVEIEERQYPVAGTFSSLFDIKHSKESINDARETERDDDGYLIR